MGVVKVVGVIILPMTLYSSGESGLRKISSLSKANKVLICACVKTKQHK